MPPLRTRALHTKADSPEQPKQADNQHIQGAEKHPVDLPVEPARAPVQTEARGQDGKVQRGVVVVDVSDAPHGYEGEVVQEPADDGVHAGVVDLVDVGLLEVRVAALPADQVP